MPTPPSFTSPAQHVASLADTRTWRPYLDEVLERHGLGAAGRAVVPGEHPTHPTFLCGDVVVKLFGYAGRWRRAYEAEHAAHVLVARDAAIRAPGLLAAGRLFESDDAPWPYLVTTRMAGVAWARAELTVEQRRTVAAELGGQVARLHALEPDGAATPASWEPGDVAAACARSSLPAHLVAQVDGFLDRLAPFDRVLVHGDLIAQHVFVADGHLAGVIDWGDAVATDRHAELIQLLRDLFDCDSALLRTFLEASRWERGADFARRALGLALHRQALGLAQHRSMDVFEPVAARYPLAKIATLDELAALLFDVEA